MPCPQCGRDHKRSKNGPCPACYRRAYRKTPEGKAIVDKANKKYVKTHPEKRTEFVVRYRNKTGYYVPTEVHQLNVANKRLEAALAAAANGAPVRQPSQRRCEQSIERRNRFENRTGIFGTGKSGGAGGLK